MATSVGEDEVRRSSGRRRKIKGSMAGGQQKKTPQRGMGVAKLERLRTMTEINQQCFADATNFVFNTGYLGIPNSDDLGVPPNSVNQHCNACHKKKKVDVVTSNIGDCGILGLNLTDNQNIIKEQNQGLPLLGYAVGNARKQGVEVVAVHMKGEGERGRVVMEYEFFPSCDGELMKRRVKSETTSSSSSSSTRMAGFDASNFIDLSLKLSY